jgi:2-dehydro-3-deoxyphosphogluconate aldolase/(4S)-4-hydroxy-2-oxoglutarate aldolase
MSRFTRLEIYGRLLDEGLVPIFHHADPDIACRVVAAVAEGGGALFEFTNRSALAIEAFRAAAAHSSKHLPRMILGAGSIVDEPTAALYIAHGAQFIVGPSFNERVARLCNRRRIAYLPGCQTATEIATAEEMGAEIIKLFPALAAGGPDFIRQILGPSPATRLLPTSIGEVSVAALATWFKAGACCVGIGGELFPPDRIAAGDFAAVAARVADVREMVRQARASAPTEGLRPPGPRP